MKQHLLFATAIVSMGAGVLFAGSRSVVVVATLAAVVSWSRVHHRRYIRNIWLRRSAKFVPYVVPVFTFGLSFHVEPWQYPAAAVPALLLISARWHSLKTAFNRNILGLMPRQSVAERWTESLFFAGPAIAQEYLYRFVLMSYLVEDWRASPWVAATATGLLFTAEHFVGAGRHTVKNLLNAATWLGLGVYFGFLTSGLYGLPAVILGHLIINTPAAIMPHLRGLKGEHAG